MVLVRYIPAGWSTALSLYGAWISSNAWYERAAFIGTVMTVN